MVRHLKTKNIPALSCIFVKAMKEIELKMTPKKTMTVVMTPPTTERVKEQCDTTYSLEHWASNEEPVWLSGDSVVLAMLHPQKNQFCLGFSAQWFSKNLLRCYVAMATMSLAMLCASRRPELKCASSALPKKQERVKSSKKLKMSIIEDFFVPLPCSIVVLPTKAQEFVKCIKILSKILKS